MSRLSCIILALSAVLCLVMAQQMPATDEKIVADFLNRYSPIEDNLNGIPVRNMTCITRHCTGQISACIGDALCRQDMQCAGQCAADDTVCTFVCTESYQNPKAAAMMQCLYVDYECLSLPPPDALNNATCREPTQHVESVDEDLLNGDWYVLQGFNPLYDCFACQELTFSVNDGKIDYSALFNMLAANKTEIWVTADMEGEDRSTPGLLKMTGSENGLPDEQDWYVMLLTDDTLVVYYCGAVLSWHFEGLLVMSKTKELNKDREADIAAILASLDIAEDELCVLDPLANCDASPAAALFIQ